MKISPTFLSFFLALSAPAIINADNQGSFTFHDNESSAVFVSGCSSNTVTVAGNNGLKPGFIIAQVDESNADNCVAECSFLFRKVASIGKDGTYDTTLATFSDIFPTETYDNALAATSVESMFKCGEYGEFRRELETTQSPTASPTLEPVFCSIYPYLNIIVSVTTGISVVLPFLLPLIPFLLPVTLAVALYFAATNTCGVTWDNFLDTLLSTAKSMAIEESARSYAIKQYEADNTADAGDRLLTQMVPFNPLSNKWMTISVNTGECDYVKCNVGFDGDASACFSKDLITTDFNFNEMINMEKVVSAMDSDIIKAFSALDYCYATSTFDKDTCDSIIYKSLVNTCSGSTTLQTFPLQLSYVSNDCHVLSLLFHLGTQKFGSKLFEEKQMVQMKYNGEDSCNKLITNQI